MRLRRGPSDFGYDPMISPTLCQISFTALKSKFSPRPMAFAVDNGRKDRAVREVEGVDGSMDRVNLDGY